MENFRLSQRRMVWRAQHVSRDRVMRAGTTKASSMRTSTFLLQVPKILIGFMVLLVAGCASGPIEVPPEAVVHNRQHIRIKTLVFRPCETTRPWTAIHGSSIASGASLRFELPKACVDLQAHAEDGTVLGTQYDIKRQYPFRWELY
jgi:hypothetical protein